MDPGSKSAWRDTSTNRTVDFLSDKFIDFARFAWHGSDLPAEIRAIPKSEWLIFFDDHNDHITRLQSAKEFGFQHVLFDDNYIAGFGDSFSVKAACNGGQDNAELLGLGGATRRAFAKNPNRPFRRCVAFHRECHQLSEAEASTARSQFLDLVDMYWETPPLAPLTFSSVKDETLQATQPFAQYTRVGSWAEGVGRKLTYDEIGVLLQNCKQPLLQNFQDAEKVLQIPTKELVHEAGNFCNMAYVRIRQR
eukprot:TRINITY_DN56636_c0_g1_i1.p1 TRINITY_DN56636_c0_g1~~TRINITY_DN56636_c0_g1_i1.p1  ORF type:complete len:250 (-),score=34.02 TRINITY_DN56636_c0_g1_i1:234-983(-)